MKLDEIGDDDAVLVCKPRMMLTEEQAAGTDSIIKNCQSCTTEVWMVPRNYALVEQKGAKILCWFCAAVLTASKKARGVDPEIQPARAAVDELEKKT